MKLRVLAAALGFVLLAACEPVDQQTPVPSSAPESSATVTSPPPTSTVVPEPSVTTSTVPTSTTVVPTPTVTAQPPTTTVVPPPVTVTPVPTTTVPPVAHGRIYPKHSGIFATTFWVGEIFDPNLPDGSQVCSAYDAQWAYHWSGGINKGTAGGKTDCKGSIVGGCDGKPKGNVPCATEARTPDNGFFPTSKDVHPKENPFYLDLPYDDINNPDAFKNRCKHIPWANDPGYAGKCGDSNFSYMKNRWVKITGPNKHVCYGQNEDAGPSHDDVYYDFAYVFGTNNAKPSQGKFNDAGMDVSPALNGCLGFKELDGENDQIDWEFVDAGDVPDGPWKIIVTTSGVTG